MLVAVPAVGPTAAASTPSAADAARIEARYTPPRWGSTQARSVDAYLRTYWRDAVDPDVVAGQYSALGPDRGVRLLASAADARLIADGGCGVVNVRYRVSTGELAASCGGR